MGILGFLFGKKENRGNSNNHRNISASVKNVSTNCDGCPNQANCEYGYVIYDEYEHFKMTLLDKYTFLYECSDLLKEVEEQYKDVLSCNKFRTDKRALEKIKTSQLERRLEYLSAERKVLLTVGKCGRSKYNSMNRAAEMKLIKEILKERKEKQK